MIYKHNEIHCVKSVQIRSFFWSVFYRIQTENGETEYKVSLRIQAECGKVRTRKNSVFGHLSCSDSGQHQKRQGRNKITVKLKCMILISPCCCTFENAATRLKDAATRFSHKLLLQCPNETRKKTRNEISTVTLLYSFLSCWCYNSCKYPMESNPEIMC